MSILVNKNTKVITQGITGKTGHLTRTTEGIGSVLAKHRHDLNGFLLVPSLTANDQFVCDGKQLDFAVWE